MRTAGRRADGSRRRIDFPLLLAYPCAHSGGRTMGSEGTLAIVVGGGPAPGINSVISAAVIEAINRGFRVLGVPEGFRHLMRRDVSRVRELRIGDVSRIHLTGGSVLGTARDNPTKSDEAMAAVIASLDQLGATHLATIGGDDTALSSSSIARAAQ